MVVEDQQSNWRDLPRALRNQLWFSIPLLLAVGLSPWLRESLGSLTGTLAAVLVGVVFMLVAGVIKGFWLRAHPSTSAQPDGGHAEPEQTASEDH